MIGRENFNKFLRKFMKVESGEVKVESGVMLMQSA